MLYFVTDTEWIYIWIEYSKAMHVNISVPSQSMLVIVRVRVLQYYLLEIEFYP